MSGRERLRELRRSGLLAEHYDEVAALLAAMPPEERARSARLLAGVDAEAVARRHPGLRRVKAVLTGHGTLEALRTALTGELARHGLLPEVELTGYGTSVAELGDPGSSLYAAGAELTVCVLDHTAVLDEVPVPFDAEDVARVLREKLALWRDLAAVFARTSGGTLVFNTIPLPRAWQVRLLDHPSRARLGALWREANAGLLRLGEDEPRVTVLDLDPLLFDAPGPHDPRLEVYAGAHLSEAVLGAYAAELAHLVRAGAGRGKKVLALDLDHTLWGGVLGDDGVEGLEVAHTPRGEAFRAFQTLVKQLQSQGVLLAAVSKNDPETVLAALRGHPDLVLREEDFVAVLAGWKPKAESLRTLAAELNLGLDAVVFADDSAHECAAVAAELPEVTVLHLAGDPALHVRTLLADGWFTATGITSEDRRRTLLYRQESARAEFLSAAGSAADFLAGLGVEVSLASAGEADLPRLAQLTLRTNQFNLTTERLSVEEVRARAADPARRVLAISSADRFGGNGVVGALFLRAGPGPVLVVENMLLSCRVFARGIEQACLSAVLEAARAAGYRTVRGEYRPTAKNAKVGDLYPHYGFTSAEPGERGTVHFHDLASVVAVPGHLSLTAGEGLVPPPLTT